MRDFLSFWKACFVDAFGKSWIWGGAVNFVLSILVPIAPLVVQGVSSAWIQAYFVALATLGVVWLVLFVRLFVWSPFVVYKATRGELEKLQTKTAEQSKMLSWEAVGAQLAKGFALVKHYQNNPSPIPADQPEEWLKETADCLRIHAPDFVYEFLATEDLPEAGALPVEIGLEPKRWEALRKVFGRVAVVRRAYGTLLIGTRIISG